MLPAALVAFGHFLAFFALTAALVLQLALLTESMSLDSARRIQRANLVLGIAAVLLLLFGFLRVYYEKGGEYYFDNVFFWLKLGLYITAAAISVYPSLIYRRWNSELQQEIAPEIDSQTVTLVKKIIHWELVLVLGILICASLMAKGYGILG